MTRETLIAVDREGTEDNASSPECEVPIDSDKNLKNELIHSIENKSKSAPKFLNVNLTEQITAEIFEHDLQNPVYNINAIIHNGSENNKLSAIMKYCKAVFIKSCFTSSKNRADYVFSNKINYYF